MPTPHNSAQKGDFARTVLMPGDPLRAQFVAETFLENAKLVNNVRGIQGYTGTYQGVPVSVMASGMGMPSMGIYSYELFTEYDVDNIIRIGSAGALSTELALRDIVVGIAACTNSNYPVQYGLHGTFAPVASYELLTAAVNAAEKLGIAVRVGSLYSSDNFYDASDSTLDWAKMGVLATEMESAALYCNAAFTHKRALALCSITDSLVTHEQLPHEERRTTLVNMIRIALETAVRLAKQ